MPHETLSGLLRKARAALTEAGIDTAHLDARLLLQHVTGLSHETLIAEPQWAVDEATLAAFATLLERRLKHEPVSRITGMREFYGRPFKLSAATLDPRPATETLIDAALGQLQNHSRILDLGSGSGAIIVTLLAESPGSTGVGTDISAQALETARQNADMYGIGRRLELLRSDWFENVHGRFDLIVSNPPYIASADMAALAPEVKDFDPIRALDGGADGLDAYRQIAISASAYLHPGGVVMVEIGAGQIQAVTSIFTAEGFAAVAAHRDLESHIRCLHFAASC